MNKKYSKSFTLTKNEIKILDFFSRKEDRSASQIIRELIRNYEKDKVKNKSKVEGA